MPVANHNNALNCAEDWLLACQQNSALRVSPITWAECDSWHLSASAIEHQSGGFFSIRALASTACPGLAAAHAQPMINQPEIGILGFLLRRNGETVEWLLQAKTEPGNQGGTQLAPSVQATESNYKQRHGGAATPYLDIFLNPGPHRVLANVLGSEQGSRFIGKYNRNMSILLQEDIDALPCSNLRWYPSQVLRAFLLKDFILNTDARSSLFCGDWSMLAESKEPFADTQSEFTRSLANSYHHPHSRLATTLDWLSDLRQGPRPEVREIPLAQLSSWHASEERLAHMTADDFEVRPYRVFTRDREVERWSQPLVMGKRTNQAILYCQEQDGVLHFLLRASWELGFKEAFQLGPSWQSDAMAEQAGSVEALLEDERITTLCQIQQSDEGGRFINSICTYRLSLLPPAVELPAEPHYRWLTLADLHAMRSLQGLLTNEARSLLSMLLAWA
ncbi:NDP-hexose 2,3-dehydratase family protein [Pseudomonas sp. J452]|uniref:NDP-hexose 2,3-dehydratase family protein n=1 Tax=Pseudomonas sp. J452 TaxID=2898441 RepID=UPI0021ADBB22|nr:NDP-hexose 2,3-dehydratase family protein [Pseudomonas sp. J452]UUY09067.1 NDP-hexose 2,3-dehydratase family protein [Pseudomonas sp. J452]